MPFDHTKYTNAQIYSGSNNTPLPLNEGPLPSPHSDAYANNGFVISFYHMITGKELRFKAFLTALNETYTPDYASEQVFGRMDPIHTYKGTTRSIALGFKIPAASMSEAYENLAKTQTLIQMQYPAYTDVKSALTIAQAPLIRIKVMNIIRAADKGARQNYTGRFTLYDSYQSENNTRYGLLGVIDSLTVDHQLSNDDIGVLEKGINTVLPKNIEVNLNFKPLHEHTNGWKINDLTGLFDFAEPAFPYGAAEHGNPGRPPSAPDIDFEPSPESVPEETPPATSDSGRAELDTDAAAQAEALSPDASSGAEVEPGAPARITPTNS